MRGYETLFNKILALIHFPTDEERVRLRQVMSSHAEGSNQLIDRVERYLGVTGDDVIPRLKEMGFNYEAVCRENAKLRQKNAELDKWCEELGERQAEEDMEGMDDDDLD